MEFPEIGTSSGAFLSRCDRCGNPGYYPKTFLTEDLKRLCIDCNNDLNKKTEEVDINDFSGLPKLLKTSDSVLKEQSEDRIRTEKAIKTADVLLKEAADILKDRAKERDTDAERSMKKCVDNFNRTYGTNLTEHQGWMFMVHLKIARSSQGEFKLDDYVDLSAYSALAAECLLKEGKK